MRKGEKKNTEGEGDWHGRRSYRGWKRRGVRKEEGEKKGKDRGKEKREGGKERKRREVGRTELKGGRRKKRGRIVEIYPAPFLPYALKEI